MSDPVSTALKDVDAAHLPNVFLVGAMKSGTSWLARQMESHPEIFVPRLKEPNFLVSPTGDGFALKGPRSEEELLEIMHGHATPTVKDYAACYAPGAAQALRLDGSIRYLVSDQAADRIEGIYAQTGAQPRILIILRDPVARIWSHWQMHRTLGLEPLSLKAALAAETERERDGWSEDWGYRFYSRYEAQLPRYLDRFGAENVMVLFYEETMSDPTGTMARVYDFLGVDPKHAAQASTETRVRKQKPTGSTEIEQLTQYYRPSWRKLIPRPVRKGIWNLLYLLNRQRKPRQFPDAIKTQLRAEMAPTASGVATLLGRETPWPGT